MADRLVMPRPRSIEHAVTIVACTFLWMFPRQALSTQDDRDQGACKEAYHDCARKQGSESKRSLGRIVIKAKRPTAVTLDDKTVTKQEIDESGYENTLDLLGHWPGMYLVPSSRGESTFVFHGFDQKQISLSIDGIPIQMPYDGGFDLAMVSLGGVESITLSSAAGSLAAGPGGLGGSLDISLGRPGKGPLLRTWVQGGRLGEVGFGLSHSKKIGSFGYTLGMNLHKIMGFPLSSDFEPTSNEDGGMRNNSARNVKDLVATASLAPSSSHEIMFRLYYVDADKDVPPLAREGRARYWKFTYWRALVTSLGHSGSYMDGSLKVDETVFYTLYENLLDSYDDPTYTTQEKKWAFHSLYEDYSAGGRFRLEKNWATGAGPLALHVWAVSSYDRHWARPDRGEDAETRHRTFTVLAPDLSFRPLRSLEFVAGGTLYIEAARDASPELEPGFTASVRYSPLDWLDLGFTATRNVRFPTLKERFSEALGKRTPNPDLRPEKAYRFELDWVVRTAEIVASRLSIFDSEATDLIADKTLDDGLLMLDNIEKARLAGLDLDVLVKPWTWLSLSAGYCYTFAKALEPVSRPLEYRPAHVAAAEIGLSPLSWIKLTMSLHASFGTKYKDPNDSSNFLELDPIFLLGARLLLDSGKGHRFWFKLSNILDSDYEQSYGFPGPGREFWTGVSLEI